MLSAVWRTRLEQGSGAVAALCGVAYPLALHLTPDVRLLGPIVLVLASALLLRLGLSPLEPAYKLLGAALAAALLIGTLVAGPVRLLRWQPALLNLALLFACSYSLYRGTPLIERIAQARNMGVGDHNRYYLRCLTAVWAAFFALASLLSLLSATAAHQHWVLWNGGGVYAAIAVLVIGERLYRIRYQRWLAREGRLPHPPP